MTFSRIFQQFRYSYTDLIGITTAVWPVKTRAVHPAAKYCPTCWDLEAFKILVKSCLCIVLQSYFQPGNENLFSGGAALYPPPTGALSHIPPGALPLDPTGVWVAPGPRAMGWRHPFVQILDTPLSSIHWWVLSKTFELISAKIACSLMFTSLFMCRNAFPIFWWKCCDFQADEYSAAQRLVCVLMLYISAIVLQPVSQFTSSA